MDGETRIGQFTLGQHVLLRPNIRGSAYAWPQSNRNISIPGLPQSRRNISMPGHPQSNWNISIHGLPQAAAGRGGQSPLALPLGQTNMRGSASKPCMSIAADTADTSDTSDAADNADNADAAGTANSELHTFYIESYNTIQSNISNSVCNSGSSADNPCNTTQHNTTQHTTTPQHNATQRNTAQHNATNPLQGHPTQRES